MTSYRIPAVFFTPDINYRGAVIDRLSSQVDLAPTLLSLAGVTFDAPFFGQDLLGLPEEGGRAFVNHNRSIGMLTDQMLVVLGLTAVEPSTLDRVEPAMRSARSVARDPTFRSWRRIPPRPFKRHTRCIKSVDTPFRRD